MKFEWDPNKAKKNLAKHGVSFQEATTVFDDVVSVTVPDPDHSMDEHRFIIIGESNRGRLLIVSHAERDDGIRLISARELTNVERKIYEESDSDRS